MKQYSLEQYIILLTQFFEWENLSGLEYLNLAPIGFEIHHEFDNLVTIIKDLELKDKNQKNSILYKNFKIKIAERSMNNLIKEVAASNLKKSISLNHYNQILSFSSENKKIELWDAALKQNIKFLTSFLYKNLYKNSDRIKNILEAHLIKCPDLNKEAYEDLKNNSLFKESPEFIMQMIGQEKLDFLSEVDTYTFSNLQDYIKRESNETLRELIYSKYIKKNFTTNLINKWESEFQLSPVRIEKIFGDSEIKKSKFSWSNLILMYPDPLLLFIKIPNLKNEAKKDPFFFEKLICHKNINSEIKGKILEEINFDINNLQLEELGMVKGNNHVFIMKWIIQKGIDLETNIQTIDMSKIPVQHQHKVKLKTKLLMDVWKERLSSENKTIIEHEVLKRKYKDGRQYKKSVL